MKLSEHANGSKVMSMTEINQVLSFFRIPRQLYYPITKELVDLGMLVTLNEEGSSSNMKKIKHLIFKISDCTPEKISGATRKTKRKHYLKKILA
jgi:hypothetical protein